MTDNFRRFSAAVGRFAERDVPKAVADATAKIALQALRGVVLKTPVDTGRARGNWNTSVGSPSPEIGDTTDKGGGATISGGATVILSARPFSTIWLSNNLPYIQRLEHGWSGQAPNGMVSVTVTEIQSQFRRIE